jgi:predicted  nucleic acid-binding Zn-ribbon protein
MTELQKLQNQVNEMEPALVTVIELAKELNKEIITLRCDNLSMRERIVNLEAAIESLKNKGFNLS